MTAASEQPLFFILSLALTSISSRLTGAIRPATGQQCRATRGMWGGTDLTANVCCWLRMLSAALFAAMLATSAAATPLRINNPLCFAIAADTAGPPHRGFHCKGDPVGYQSRTLWLQADLSKSKRGQGNKKYLNERGFRILAALDKVAKQYGSTPAKVSIGWLLARPSITAPIASATNLDQLNDLIDATKLKLDRAAVEELNRAAA